MKHRHLIALLQSGYTTIQVAFPDAPVDRSGNRKIYTYKVPLDWHVAVADNVVIDSPNSGLVVCEVVAVDASPNIDLDAEWTYKWAVQKVDTTFYNAQNVKERDAMAQLVELERNKQRDALLAQYRSQFPEGSNVALQFEQTVNMLQSAEVKGVT